MLDAQLLIVRLLVVELAPGEVVQSVVPGDAQEVAYVARV